MYFFVVPWTLTGIYDESSGVRHVRRMFHPGRGLGGPRARRTNMHFTSSSNTGLSSSQSSSYSPSNREAMDPIAGAFSASLNYLCLMRLNIREKFSFIRLFSGMCMIAFDL